MSIVRLEAPPHPTHQTLYSYPDIDFSTNYPLIATAVITAIMRSASMATACMSFFSALVIVVVASDLGVEA